MGCIKTTLTPPVPIRTVLANGQGPAGTPGISPPGSDLHYVYVQSTPSDTWTISHNLGKFPSITVIDSSGAEVEGGVAYIDSNALLLTFSAAFSGTAYLN